MALWIRPILLLSPMLYTRLKLLLMLSYKPFSGRTPKESTTRSQGTMVLLPVSTFSNSMLS